MPRPDQSVEYMYAGWGEGEGRGEGTHARVSVRARLGQQPALRSCDGRHDRLRQSSHRPSPPLVEGTLPWLVCWPGVVHILVRVGLGSGGS
eukprot:scaffold40476_cov68-Phaeocystis_antarctica.AAC.2